MQILKFKKGQNRTGDAILAVIIGVVILAAFTGILLGGFNEFSEEDACTDASCSFNNPAGFCAINASSEGSGISCPNDVRESLPLGVLFTIVLGLVFAAGAFVAIRNMLKKV